MCLDSAVVPQSCKVKVVSSTFT